MKNLRSELSQAFIALLIVALIGVSIYAGALYRQKTHAVSQQKANPATFNQPNEPVSKFTTSDGVTHNTYKARETYKGDIKQGNSISPEYVDSLARALQISNTDFKEVVIINAALEGKLKAFKIAVDSLKQRTWYFQQKYLTAEFSEKDSVLDYKYNAEIGYAKYDLKSGFLNLGPKKKQIDIFSKDPDMTINGVKQLSINDDVRRKPFGISIQAGYFWNPATGLLEKGLGFGVSYSLIRF